jgi:hypothetical protein
MQTADMQRTERILAKVRAALAEEIDIHGEIYNPREGIAHIWQDVTDLWDEIRAGAGHSEKAALHAVLIAALVLQYILDMTDYEKTEGDEK